MDETSVGRTVQWARKRAGMTQQQLAQALEMPQPSIARIERGTVVPRTATLIAILDATGHQLAVEPVDPPVDLEGIRRQLALAAPARTIRALGRRKPQRRGPIWALAQLRLFGVPFVLVGQLAEVAHGVPGPVEEEIEIVHARTDVANDRLAKALEDLRGSKTDTARLRLLTATAAGDDYEVLARNAVRMPVDSGVVVAVAAIEDLIRARLAGCTPDDRQVAAVLRAVAGTRIRRLP